MNGSWPSACNSSSKKSSSEHAMDIKVEHDSEKEAKPIELEEFHVSQCKVQYLRSTVYVIYAYIVLAFNMKALICNIES